MISAYRKAPPVVPPSVLVYHANAISERLVASALVVGVVGVNLLIAGANPMALMLVPLAFAAIAFILLGMAWHRVTVRFDWAARVVVLEWPRWPSPGSSQSFPIDDVVGVEVGERTSKDGGVAYRAVLTLSSGERIPLLDGSTNRGHHARVARQIRWLLDRKEMSLHGAPG